MKESEAKEKWCPFSMAPMFIGQSGFGTGNRSFPADKHDEHFRPKCLGSACMAWRWNVVDSSGPEIESLPLKVHGGYCGLAGRP
jgi:hypothetical protein